MSTANAETVVAPVVAAPSAPAPAGAAPLNAASASIIPTPVVAPASTAPVVPMAPVAEAAPEGTKRSWYSIFHTITAIFAIYLSFKCNKGFNFGGFLLACCCPYIYIIYQFATRDDFCGLRGE